LTTSAFNIWMTSVQVSTVLDSQKCSSNTTGPVSWTAFTLAGRFWLKTQFRQ